MSKHLESILSRVPPATANDPNKNLETPIIKHKNKETERIVAVIPKTLKKEIKNYIEKNYLETERTIILKALKIFGFNVKEEWIVDKRKTR